MAKNQNRIRNRWELITCGLGGHVTYAPDDAALAARLRASTGLGEVWRCLRCGDFALGGPQGRGAPEDAPLIMRGKALRQAIIIRALGDTAQIRQLLRDRTNDADRHRHPFGRNSISNRRSPAASGSPAPRAIVARKSRPSARA